MPTSDPAALLKPLDTFAATWGPTPLDIEHMVEVLDVTASDDPIAETVPPTSACPSR